MTPHEQEALFDAWCALHPEWNVRVLETVDVAIPVAEVRRTFDSIGDLMQLAADDFIFSDAERAERFSNPRFWWIERIPTRRPSLTSSRSGWNSSLTTPHMLLVDTLSLDTEVTDMHAIIAGELDDISQGRVSFRSTSIPDKERATELRELLFDDGTRKLSDANTKATIYDHLRPYSLNFYANEDHPFVVHAQRAVAERRVHELRSGSMHDTPWRVDTLLTYVIEQSVNGSWFAQPTGHDDVFGSATTVDALQRLLPMDRDDIVAGVSDLARRGELLRTITGHVLPSDWTFPEHVKRTCGVPSLLTLLKPESRNTFLMQNPSYAETLDVPDTAADLIDAWARNEFRDQHRGPLGQLPDDGFGL